MSYRLGFHARGRDIAESQANARVLEAAGIDSIWVGDSSFDAYVHSAALAAVTRTIKLGTAVTLLTRTPVAAVHAATGLDALSNGRFTLGLGVGPSDWNRDWHGLNPDRPAQRMAEYVQCFKAAWESGPGRPARFDGEIFSVRNYQRARRGPSDRIDILIGTVGPLSTRNAAQFADGVIFDIVLPRSYIERVGLPALAEGLRRAGKRREQITVGGLMAVSVDPDGATARRRARHNILAHLGVHYYMPVFEAEGFGDEANRSWEALRRGDIEGALDALSDRMVQALCIAGTPDEVRRQMASWGEIMELMIASTPAHHLAPEEAAWAHRQAVEVFAR